MAPVNRTRRRRSGTRQALASHDSKWLGAFLWRLLVGSRLGDLGGSRGASLGAPLRVLLLARLRLLEQRDRPAGGLDLLESGRRGAVHRDRELLRQVADAEQLDVDPQRADQALRLQRLGR